MGSVEINTKESGEMGLGRGGGGRVEERGSGG